MKRFDLLKNSWSHSAHKLPLIITPHGLSAEHQWYLYEQIRPFCPDDKDFTCPSTIPAPEDPHDDTASPPNISVPVAHADITAVHARISKTALKTSYRH